MVSFSEIKKGLFSYKEVKQGWMVSIKSASDLLKAAEKARDSQSVSNFDCFSPFPIHGIEKAMGLGRSWLPLFTLLFGLLGCISIFAFMSYVDIFDWPMNVGGKPYFAWPAYIPITFEVTVLSAGLASVFAVIYLGKLGKANRELPIANITSTGFGIWIEDEIEESEVMSIMGNLAGEVVRVRS